jgi:hypothetical protein
LAVYPNVSGRGCLLKVDLSWLSWLSITMYPVLAVFYMLICPGYPIRTSWMSYPERSFPAVLGCPYMIVLI